MNSKLIFVILLISMFIVLTTGDKCLKADQSCYGKKWSCCDGLRCGSGGATSATSQPGDTCISDLIIG